MRRLLPLLTALAALVPLTVAAAGCGEDDLPEVSAAEAAASTRDAGTVRATFRMEMRGMNLPEPISVTGEGVSATDSFDGDLTFEFGGGLDDVGELRVVFDRGEVFLDPPEIDAFEVPDGATWVTADLRAVTEAAGLDPVGLSELLRMSLAQQVAALEAAKSMKEVGEEEVGGVRTVHLRGTTTTSDYLALLPPQRRARAERAMREFEQRFDMRPGELDEPTATEVWIDGDRLIRRLRSEAELPAEDGVAAGHIAMTMDLDDYGTPLDVERPPDDEVYDATDDLKDAIASGALGG